MTAKNQGKPENRKRKCPDADEESEEEEAITAAAERTARKKSKTAGDSQSESNIVDADSDDFLIDAYARLGLKSRRGSLPSASTDDDRKDKDDRRTLFLKNVPGNCTVRQIKALSKDIKHVRLRSTLTRIDDKRKRILYAYVSFASEEVAEKNFKLLDGKEFNGTIISVDYVGSKSKFLTTRPKTEPEKMYPLRLYLSGLPGNATEGDIQKLFPEAVEIELPKRKKDKLLLGYGFVGFNDPALTSKYHDQCQDLVLHGNKLVVVYAKQRKRTEKNKRAKQRKREKKKKQTQKAKMYPLRLYLSGLPGNATKGDIKKLFPGAVKIVLPKRKKDKLLLGYGFVRFNNPALTLKYYDQGQDLVLHGNKLVVLYAKRRKREKKKKRAKLRKRGQKKWKQTQKEDSCTLFVKNLPEDATVDNLSAIFDTASDVRIPMRDGVHKGFGFVAFSDKESLKAAMSEKQGAKLNGSELFLYYAVTDRRNSSGMRGESNVLFVKNLSYDTDESSLIAAFDGAVSARIPTFPESGKSRGFGFVEYSSAEAAADAFDSMNGQSVDGRQVTLDFDVGLGRLGSRGFGIGRAVVLVTGADPEVVMTKLEEE